MLKQVLGLLLSLALAGPVMAQVLTLEDIRSDLSMLGQELESLRGELDTSGNTGLSPREAASLLVRIDEINADLRAALGRVQSLEIKVERIVDDGSRRIGDIEFRLTELEGGDPNLVGTPPPLGGVEAEVDVLSQERQAFNAAKKALQEGDGGRAAALLTSFLSNYPDGPLTSEARYLQGQGMVLTGDYQNAARAFLSGFSGAPDSPFAALSLFGLSKSLYGLGQGDQACLTLAEIQIRYVDIDAKLGRDIAQQRGIMSCP
ncbi:MAG: tol-pal system protein [Rhodobacteraceae bacterium]|nr:tol-pal system protein [Paracoccaceae bacterium]